MAKKFNSNLCIFIALILNFIIINILKNENEIGLGNKLICGPQITEKFDTIQDIQNTITNIILFNSAAVFSSTILLVFIVGLSVFLISRDYKKTLISIFVVIIINTIFMRLLLELVLDKAGRNPNWYAIAMYSGCGYNLLEDGGKLKYNKLFYYYSKIKISNLIFTYLIASICVSIIN